MASTAITRIGGEVFTLEDLLKKAHGEIQRALPIAMSPDRLARVALTSVRKNDALKDCDALSIVACVIKGAELGVELDGVLGNAYMVPFANEAQFLMGYKGYITLGYRSDRVSQVDAKNVYDGDDFDYQMGTQKYIHHVPQGEYKHEKITHSYAIIHLTDGSVLFDVWPRERIENWRDRFSQSYKKHPKSSPWTQAPEAMFLKTVIRSVFKTAPISVGVQEAIGLDNQYDAGISQNLSSELSDKIAPSSESSDDNEILNRDEVMKSGDHEGVAWRDLPEKVVKTLAERGQDKRMKSLAQQELAEREKGTVTNEKPKTGNPGIIAEKEDQLTNLLSNDLFTDEDLAKYGPESEGGNHDAAWLDDQIQWVITETSKRKKTGQQTIS